MVFNMMQMDASLWLLLRERMQLLIPKCSTCTMRDDKLQSNPMRSLVDSALKLLFILITLPSKRKGKKIIIIRLRDLALPNH
ncbi:hypothetical protein SADUNF_Sadunf02G0184500 [Salix dunnii]|uniref:Uncharacterized protein n=1 Tax=Salix dunnii TaxID=1413687 RepID=A0A835N8M2_9ROSI|nr:hypothetical protein SADUNF_Sadunf02G0184500 [Salix dunnii]